jgi:hypothetical protein
MSVWAVAIFFTEAEPTASPGLAARPGLIYLDE